MPLGASVVLGDLVQHAALRFQEVGIDSPQVDSELLAAHVLGLSRGEVQSAMISGRELTSHQAEQLADMFGRRLAREPLQHITGVAFFRNLKLQVGLGVFIPRPETEIVAQLAIDALRNTPAAQPIAVDLGSGTGAIALAISTEVPHSKVFAVEKSELALPFTRKNFETYAAENAFLIEGDLEFALGELDGTVAVVASNPPYIPERAIPRDIEVRDFDPKLALYGGEDGMDVMRLVSASAQRLLYPGGTLVVEHADSQGAQVCQLLLADGWRQVESHKDLTGRDRAVTAIK